MKPDWIDLSICTIGCIVERIGHCPREESILRSDGRQRLLGIAPVEDKIVQQAVVTILNQIDEMDDNMSHEWTMKFVEHRVADRRILGLIQK